ncbi:unnamed protein product [Mucor hiemalis]
MKMNIEGRYIHNQVKTATIPTRYEEKNKWLDIFDIVAYLLNTLETQVVILAKLDAEQDGKINVKAEKKVRDFFLIYHGYFNHLVHCLLKILIIYILLTYNGTITTANFSDFFQSMVQI